MDLNVCSIHRRNIDVPTCVDLAFMHHYTMCVYCIVLATLHLGSIFTALFILGIF